LEINSKLLLNQKSNYSNIPEPYSGCTRSRFPCQVFFSNSGRPTRSRCWWSASRSRRIARWSTTTNGIDWKLKYFQNFLFFWNFVFIKIILNYYHLIISDIKIEKMGFYICRQTILAISKSRFCILYKGVVGKIVYTGFLHCSRELLS